MPFAFRHNRRVGFTLIELLIVLSLMGIIAAAVIPSASPSIREQLYGTAKILVGDLEYAQSLALTNNSTYKVEFDVDDNLYYIEHTGPSAARDDLPDTPLRDEDDPADQQFTRLDNLPQQGISARLAAVYAGGGPPQAITAIEFNGLGATTRAEESVVWLAAGSGTMRRYLSVRVNPATGLTWVENFQTTLPATSAIAAP